MHRLVKASDYRRERWRNGLGWTNEIARGRVGSRGHDAMDDDSARDAWDWRLSIAEIDRDCAFSAFPGVDRTLVLLDGAGMRLGFTDGEIVDLADRDAQIDFAGERDLACTLLDGPTRDFNAMWRRDRLASSVAAHRWAAPTTLPIGPGDIVAVHVLDGALTSTHGETSFVIDQGDTLLAQERRDIDLYPDDDARVLVVRFSVIASR